MPVQFMIGPDLPSDVSVMTISYTFFELNNDTADTDIKAKQI